MNSFPRFFKVSILNVRKKPECDQKQQQERSIKIQMSCCCCFHRSKETSNEIEFLSTKFTLVDENTDTKKILLKQNYMCVYMCLCVCICVRKREIKVN